MECFIFDWEYQETDRWLRAVKDPNHISLKKVGYTHTLSNTGKTSLICQDGNVTQRNLTVSYTATNNDYFVFPGKGYYIASALIPKGDKSEYITLVVFEYQEMCYVDVEHEESVYQLADTQSLRVNYDYTVTKVARALMRGGEMKPFLAVKSYHRSFVQKVGRWYNGYEYDIDNVTLFLNRNDIPSCGWVSISSFAKADSILSYSSEFFVKPSNIKVSTCTVEPKPLVLSMDIETFTPRVGDYPHPINPEDEIKMIGTTLRWYKSSESIKIAFTTLGNLVLPNDLQMEFWLVETYGGLKRIDFYRIKTQGYDVLIFENERWMLVGYFHYVSIHKPHVIIGWNHLSYDYDYIACRYFCAKSDHVLFSRSKVWRHKWNYVQIENSAFGRDELVLIQGQGIIDIDMMQYVRKYERYQQNSLKHVSSVELGDLGKIDLDYHNMFKLLGSTEVKDILEVADYCIRDTEAPLDIFQKKETWLTTIELSKVLRIPPKNLTVKGSSAKIITQLHYHMHRNKYIVNSEDKLHQMHAKYLGAHVFEPEVGLHSDVASLDFTSLYPSIILHDNICYTTWITDKQPMVKFRNIEVPFVGHIPLKLRPYIFKKNDKGLMLKFQWRLDKKGVVPSMIQDLLDQRKHAKAQLKLSSKSEQVVWDRRQYAYKIAANSIYGVLGSRHKYLNLTSGAACVTSRGRQHLNEAKCVVEQYNGKVVYGDTDSCFIHIPNCNSYDDYIKRTQDICNEVARLNDNVIKLAFENYFPKILFFGKKRYAAIKHDGKFYAKGISLVRKNKSSYATYTYQELLMHILKHPLGIYVAESYIKKRIFDVFAGNVEASQLSKRYKWNPQKVTSLSNSLHQHCESIGRKILAGNYMEYLPLLAGFNKDAVSVRVRDTEWMVKYNLPVDYLYYIQNEMQRDIDEVFSLLNLPRIVSSVLSMIKLCIDRKTVPRNVDSNVVKYIVFCISITDKQAFECRSYSASL